MEIDKSQMASFDDQIKTLCQVADIFETPREYETAMEAILGDKLKAAVVENKDEITRALTYIREQSSKRSGFITLNPMRPVASDGAGHEDSSTPQGGVIGRAIRFVSVKEGFKGVAESLLNDVMLVDNLNTAFSLRENPAGGTMRNLTYYVTLDGDVLEPSGVVFGGVDKGVLKIKRQIKELEQEIATRKEKIAGAEQSVAAVKEVIISTENDIISIDAHISSQEKYIHGLQMKIENFAEENERLQKKHEYITLEITDDHKEKESLQAALKQKDDDCRAREEEKQQVEEKIRAVQSSISEKRESIEALRSEVTEVKLDLTSMNEKAASLKREIDRLKAAVVDMDGKCGHMLNERSHIEETIVQKEQDVVDKEDAVRSKVVAVSELQGEATRVNDILDARKVELEMKEKHQKELASELEEVRHDLSSLEMKKLELSMKLNYLKEDIHKTYSIEIETADISQSVEPEEEERLPQLKEKLQAIGPVSLGTLDEYEELKSRFEFLSQQRDDLLEAIAALEDTIQKINQTCKKRLVDAFVALNEKFKEVFTILFGKGKAELQLTEGSILDAGIEIIAQPPGKKLQNLNLLSGGEKALTALSLLFGGFMIKPTPLCLLDEVDAPLDESNTDKFTSLLKQLAENIQFITITHNRRTMEAADYIYGITMEEPGSSKVISMHLAEAV